jgi:Uma2 family endonuclease
MKALLRLARRLEEYTEDVGLGQVFIAPVDVELSPRMVFWPDVIVVLNVGLNKVQESRIVGALDLVVEVASPRTRRYDRTIKREANARAGIREYWLADPIAHKIEVLFLEYGAYRSSGLLKGQDRLVSRVEPTVEAVRVEQCFG